jgi:septal ring-binding cell division protein DamX
MRFEIKGGGVFAILLSLGILSGAVFFFGLLAGYDVGRQSQSATAEVATSYSIPSAPLAAASSAPAPVISAKPPAMVASDHRSATGTEDSEAPPPARSGDEKAGAADDDTGEAAAGPTSPAAANTPARTASLDEHPPPADTGAADMPPPDEEASPAPPKRHSFNIQIQAVMDLAGANQMIRRLSRIGYPAHMTATPIDGQTWYKVEVGPYPSQEEAATAQATMRQKYNDTYGGHTAAASSSAGSGGPAAGSDE